MSAVPPWIARVLAAELAVVLGLLLVGLLSLAPHVAELRRAADALPSASVAAEGAPATLEQVERIDANVERVVPPVIAAVESIPVLGPQLGELLELAELLRADVKSLQDVARPLGRSAEQLVVVAEQVAGLQESLDRVGAPIDSLARSAEPLPEQLSSLTASAATIASFAQVLEQLVESIGRMEQHVANLDRKTGPVLLPDLSGVE